jgi:hypothetical protein
LTSAIYNADHVNHITNHTPVKIGGYSDSAAEKQLTADPGGVGSEVTGGTLAAELEHIRFCLKRITGKTHWYEAPAATLENPAGTMAAWSVRARNAATAGAVSNAALADVATEAFGAGHFALGWLSTGELRKFSLGAIGTGKQTVWVPAAAMIPRITNGAAANTVETATNKNMIRSLDFDTATQEFGQFYMRMPKGWNEGTVSFAPIWSHPVAATNFGVVWELQGVAVSDTETGDVAFGTAQQSADVGGSTDIIYIGPESSAITIANSPAAQDLVLFQIRRAPADVNDTLAVDARLHGISLFMTLDANQDG